MKRRKSSPTSSFFRNAQRAKQSYRAGQESFDRKIAEESTWLDFAMVDDLHHLMCHLETTSGLFGQMLEVSHTQVSDWADEIGNNDPELFARGFLDRLCGHFHEITGFDEYTESEVEAIGH